MRNGRGSCRRGLRIDYEEDERRNVLILTYVRLSAVQPEVSWGTEGGPWCDVFLVSSDEDGLS